MKTTETAQTTVVTNVEVDSNGYVQAQTAVANVDAANDNAVSENTAHDDAVKKNTAQTAKLVTEGEYMHCVKLENDMADELLVGKTRKEYIADFNVNLRKTAEATLQMCRTVFEANKMLAEHEFNEFCKNIGYKDSSSTIRKFIAIGKVYPRLIKYAKDLPIAWTSIYALTQIAADDFDEMVKRGFAFRSITGKDLKMLLDRTKDLNNTSGLFKLNKKWLAYNVGHICFTKVADDRDWRLIQKAFEEIAARLPVKIVLNKEIAEHFESRRKATYESVKVESEDVVVKPQLWDYGTVANNVIEECAA
jgi:hypothetical protein